MAYQATAHHSPAANVAHGVLAAFGRFFRGVGRGVMAAAEANGRLKKVQMLQAKSDAELARIGIKREDIVNHVFSDLYYI